MLFGEKVIVIYNTFSFVLCTRGSLPPDKKACVEMATLLFQRVLKWCFAFSNIDVMYCQKGVYALKMSFKSN